MLYFKFEFIIVYYKKYMPSFFTISDFISY